MNAEVTSPNLVSPALNPPLVEGADPDAVLEYNQQDAWSFPPTPGGALSTYSGNAEVHSLTELVTAMRGTLDHLGGVFDSLGEQTARVGNMLPAIQAAHQIKQFTRQLGVQEQRQEERVQALKVLLRDVLKEQIGNHLRYHVHQIIQEKVKERVAERVRAQLDAQFPPKLRDEVKRHKLQLQDVKRSLHDSNARRHNGLLKEHQREEPLDPLMDPSGNVVPDFPKTLGELFALDGERSKALCKRYELPVVESGEEEDRAANLNTFMHHIGTPFYVAPPPKRKSFQALTFSM